MKFGRVPLDDADGGILVHTVKAGRATIRKGTRLAASDLTALRAGGIEEVMVARLEPDDVGENDAAGAIAAAAAGAHISHTAAANGRCNLIAEAPGLAVLDRARIDTLNGIDEGATIATIEPMRMVQTGELLATIKIVPFAVSRATVERCVAAAGDPEPIVAVADFALKRVGLLQTVMPGAKQSLISKMSQASAKRVERLGGELIDIGTCDHDERAVADALERLVAHECDIALVLGASAIADRRDVVPGAIVQAGGRILRFGMPVDPGHLTLLAELGAMTVLGVPGSSRSPRRQGFDWVMQRLFAGLEIDDETISRMGVGGLLKEIPERPMLRRITDPARKPSTTPKVAALVLAAGQSRRMGARNKLLAEIDGIAMVRRVVEAVIASHAKPVLVVTGYEADRVRGALVGLAVSFVDNPDFDDGISASLRHGLAALPSDSDGVLVCLGDMPRVDASMLDKLISAFEPEKGTDICVPVHQGKRGNPVLWGKRYFADMGEIAGDVGAKYLIGRHAEAVREVAITEDGVLIDVDSPEALAALTTRSGQSRPGD
ncbi:MAG: molybdopterin-binding/glycosyltransferase family 2 protein [Alphaproteobacteria bacterium]|nr:molybdopterin-binding/glycosyltransferase family 2 protein [Alphaproteobacteria bacterium]